MSVLETLLANPGLYTGTSTEHDGSVSVARIVISPLPNRASVSIDYEARHAANPNQWVEHAILGRDLGGALVLITSCPPDESLLVLRPNPDDESFFVNDPAASKFPAGIRVECAQPGALRYDWWYSMPGKPLERHDDTTVQLVK